MSTAYNSRIVTDGLVLCLDAANPKSYPGSGTAWNDLSGNGNNGTLTNGPTYNSGNKGSIVFDGVDDFISSFPTQISGTGSKTISCFFNTTNTIRQTLCETRNNNLGVGWGFIINRTNSGNLTYFHSPGGTLIEVYAGITINTWYNVAVVYNLETATATLYLNGKMIGNPVTSFPTIISSGFNGSIGNKDNTFSNNFVGNMSNIYIYNRALSPTEIQQNFNVTRGRYGV